MSYFCLMNYLKIALKFYLNSSIHVALSVYAFLRITELYFNLPYNEPLDYFIFYGTITGYNFVKYAGVAKLHHRSLTNNLKLIQIFSLVCFLLMCYYASLLSMKTLSVMVPFCMLTILYAVPFLSGFQKNLRSISYLKIVVVALVWSGVSVLLPIYDSSLVVDDKLSITLLGLERFLFVVALILPFDIRDMKYDAISLQTIPKKIGVENTKKLGFVLLLICLIIEFLITENTTFKRVFFLVFVLFLVLLMRSKENQSEYYSSLWVEAIPIIWWFLLIIL